MNQSLKQIAKEIRLLTLQSLCAAGSGHTGASLGLADIFTFLYFRQMKHRPQEPDWPVRDRLILSIGHVAPVLYATLAKAGYFSLEELSTLRKLGTRLQGHPGREHGLPGIELSAGSLGQGLSVAVGMAMAAKHQKLAYQIYAITGDGELQEGSIWEAAMSAAHYQLDNLTVVVDRNGLQIDGTTESVMKLEPLSQKWESFGWNVIQCDGHDFSEIENSFKIASAEKTKPSVIIARTIMGKGVSEIENQHQWHGKAPETTELERFINQL
jgi:transketolase